MKINKKLKEKLTIPYDVEDIYHLRLRMLVILLERWAALTLTVGGGAAAVNWPLGLTKNPSTPYLCSKNSLVGG